MKAIEAELEKSAETNLIFDPYALRLLVGSIAFSFPWVVIWRAATITSSISASYHTDARDIFVGFLFVIGALLVAYQGHTPELLPNEVGRFWDWVGGFLNWISKIWKGKTDFRVKGRKHEEDLVSTIGGVAAIVAALWPTACDTCVPDGNSRAHAIAAIILFSTVVYFCLFAFLRKVNEKLQKKDGILTFLRSVREALQGDVVNNTLKLNGMKILRGCVYLVCGFGIAVVMVGLVAAQLSVPEATKQSAITFWAETVALCLFGIAWIVASQFWFLVDDDEIKQ